MHISMYCLFSPHGGITGLRSARAYSLILYVPRVSCELLPTKSSSKTLTLYSDIEVPLYNASPCDWFYNIAVTETDICSYAGEKLRIQVIASWNVSLHWGQM